MSLLLPFCYCPLLRGEDQYACEVYMTCREKKEPGNLAIV